jgi:hypothetical protein
MLLRLRQGDNKRAFPSCRRRKQAVAVATA